MKKILFTIFVMTIIFNAFGQSVCDSTQATKTIYSTNKIRANLLDTLNKQLYVRESWGPNRGPEVDNYLKTVNCAIANPWCAAFVGANLTWQNVKNPKSAYSPNYALQKDVIWRPKNKNKDFLKTGDVVTYYYQNLGRVGHVGFFEKLDNNGYFITIEGNTNGSGSREGDGVYRKKRDPEKVYAVSRYIK